MSNPFIPKSRRPKFRLEIKIHELTNIPLVSGTVHVRWHLSSSTAGDSRGRTSRAPIKDHKCSWDYRREAVIRMVVGKDGILQESGLVCEVVQELNGGRDVFTIGVLHINLAEYCGVKREETRRHLLQKSKVNSILKITLKTHQISGDTTYRTPATKKSSVFSDITGLVSEHKDHFSPVTEEFSNRAQRLLEDRQEGLSTQDMYRSTLAARWQSMTGELDPQAAIEDIFQGGNGWREVEPEKRERLSKEERELRAQQKKWEEEEMEYGGKSWVLKKFAQETVLEGEGKAGEVT
ncbi:hypothetical protein YB2330_004888 [Saitoella coloradoensis]